MKDRTFSLQIGNHYSLFQLNSHPAPFVLMPLYDWPLSMVCIHWLRKQKPSRRLAHATKIHTSIPPSNPFAKAIPLVATPLHHHHTFPNVGPIPRSLCPHQAASDNHGSTPSISWPILSGHPNLDMPASDSRPRHLSPAVYNSVSDAQHIAFWRKCRSNAHHVRAAR